MSLAALHLQHDLPRNDDSSGTGSDTESPTPSEAGEMMGETMGEREVTFRGVEPDGAMAQLKSIERCGMMLPLGLPAETHPEVLRGNWTVERSGPGQHCTRYVEKEGLNSMDMLAMAAMVEDDQPPLASTADKRLLPPPVESGIPRKVPRSEQRYAQWRPQPPAPPPPPARWMRAPRSDSKVVEVAPSAVTLVVPSAAMAAAREACGNLPLPELEKVARAMMKRKPSLGVPLRVS